MQTPNQAELRSAIIAALAAGYLEGPVVFSGEKLDSPNLDAVGPVIGPSDGWNYAKASPLGGIVSIGVEKLRAKLINRGFPHVAGQLPTFHVGRFWQPPETHFGWGIPDPTRFDPPSAEQNETYGLSDEQLQQLQDNITAHDNFLFAIVGMGGATTAFAGAYRGQEDAVSDFPPGGFGGIERPASGWVGEWKRTYLTDQDGNPVPNRYRRDKNGPAWGDHFIYDLWFNLQTDADITRYWTAWARSFGAPV